MQQVIGAAQKESRRRALIFCGVALVALLATLKLLGVFGHFQRIEAVVIDSADSSPLSGASIVALYTRSCVGGDKMTERTVVLSRDTATDEGGAFVLEEANLFAPPGPKTFSLGLCQFADEPDVYVAKSGYITTKLSGGFTAKIVLSSRSGEENLEELRLSVNELKELLADTLLAEASPVFYARLERDFNEVSVRYRTLQKPGGSQ